MGLYRLLLRLYPIEHQADFGDEMLCVFRQAAEQHRQEGLLVYSRFLASECGGLVHGAIRLRHFQHSFTPIVGGVLLAGIVNYCFYSGVFHLVGAAGAALRQASLPATDPLSAPITISMFGVATLLSLLPLFVFLGSHVRLRRP
jgi:hypothetical protein